MPTYSLFNFFVFLCAKLFNINIYILKISPNEIFMRKFISGLFGATPRTLTICSKHDPKNMKDFDPTSNPVPYAKDYCHSCNDQICHVCSENHVHSHCDVECGINNSMGTGSLQQFNYGRVAKLSLNGMKCICGKTLGISAAICAACGLASCSQECHNRWEQMGNCTFSQNFYSTPPNFTMRSILFENIYKLKRAKVTDWAIANRSNTNMICCYVSEEHEYVLLQRGYRNYGKPNDELIQRMEILPEGIDTTLLFDRRCRCQCHSCTSSRPHSVGNCQNKCLNFDLQYIKNGSLKPEMHQQCTCPCNFCNSGVIMSTHRKIDCALFCQRSSYKKEEWLK